MLSTAWSTGGRWLPGQLLSTLAEGGSGTVPYGRAGLLLALYGVLAVTVSASLFIRRDVAT